MANKKALLILMSVLLAGMLLSAGCTSANGGITFQKKDTTVCKIDGKPVIRLYSTTFCPHCNVIKDTYDSIAKEYADQNKIVAHHWQWIFDENKKLTGMDDLLTQEYEGSVPEAEVNIFHEFNPNETIPTFVFGCKYYRIGNGYELTDAQGQITADLNAEAKEFRQVIEELLKE